ncbi:extracellular solute-binding protein [Pontivivens ytuae]|uniref:Extracellular solute-binding protein n=1 Tax=Pontivivens ytuae TaxID=2789856 RepID=A0A7S9LTN7_9RHOB|nr:extracellular solute-binding protein [Pontivivens ytuae]QPH54973.1 extracellular solute-binding protein [Pontivivens ytuae]
MDAFYAQTGLTVAVRPLSGDVIGALLEETDAGEADVFITASVTRLDEAFQNGLTEPVSSSMLDLHVPAQFRQSEGHWYGVTRRVRALYVSKDAPLRLRSLTYEDLASPYMQGRICIRSGSHPYNIALFSAYAAHHGREETRAWLAGLKQNLARLPEGNDRAQMRAVAEGICSVAVANSYYYGLAQTNFRQREWAHRIDIIFPRFEDGGSHVNMSGMAMLSSVRDRRAAQSFMEFQLSAEAQAIYARRNFEYPMRTDVGSGSFVDMWGAFESDPIEVQLITDLHLSVEDMINEMAFNE